MNRTIEDARITLRQHWEKGMACPCCTQNVKLYRRKITSTMAAFLIEFYCAGAYGDRWMTVNDRKWKYMRDGMYAKLRYWGLVEPHPKNPISGRPTKKSGGSWRVTPLGCEFVHGNVTVQKFVRVFDHRRLKIEQYERLDRIPITIKDALTDRFNYTDLMLDR